MAMTSTVRYRVLGSAGRRVVAASPVARPALHLPNAHPLRPVSPGRSAPVASCLVAPPARSRSPWLTAKLVAVSLLVAVGGAVSVAQLAGGVLSSDPAVGYVAGDPGWAHVTMP